MDHTSKRAEEGETRLTTAPIAPEAMRRARIGVLVSIGLVVLGLVPIVLVQRRLEYFAAWSCFAVISITALLLGWARSSGRTSKRTVRVIVWIVAIVATAALAVVLRLIR